MKFPNFKEEKKLWRLGYKMVAGLDEAGRGPLAGPVVAAAVIFNSPFFSKVKDSKQLSPKQRENFYEILTNAPDIVWGVGVVSEKVIDKVNIFQATKLAMVKAVKNLEKRAYQNFHDRGNSDKVGFLLIDGNFRLEKVKIPQKSVVKGDEKVFSIAAASIIAKVTRDRLMRKYHKKYPEYEFARHKGYGTKAHFASLEKFGPCKIHRKTFYPVRGLT